MTLEQVYSLRVLQIQTIAKHSREIKEPRVPGRPARPGPTEHGFVFEGPKEHIALAERAARRARRRG